MIATRTTTDAFMLEFESEQELRDEHTTNLSQGALRLPTRESVPLYSSLTITFLGPWGGEATLRGTVVALLPDGLALGIEGYGDATLSLLLWKPVDEAPALAAGSNSLPATEGEGDKKQSAWDRLHALSQTEKLLLAVKADRPERSLLLQDNDPRVLLSLLRNPRITVEEIARMAKSHFITFQVAEVIMKSPQWMANPDVRVSLVNNPKTPQAFALRILPTLPDSDVRAIARGGTSMALKQAALRKLQGKG